MDWHRTTDWIIAHWRRRREGDYPLSGPWKSHVRTAVLRPWFPVRGNARVFERISLIELADYRPELIAGPVPMLRQLAEIALAGHGDVPNPERGFVALGGIGRAPVAQRDRDLLWQAFGAPLSEEWRGWSGEVLAFGCEAHAGLHIATEGHAMERSPETGELSIRTPETQTQPAELLPTGLSATMSEDPCVCGLPGPRLIRLRLHTACPALAIAG